MPGERAKSGHMDLRDVRPDFADALILHGVRLRASASIGKPGRPCEPGLASDGFIQARTVLD